MVDVNDHRRIYDEVIESLDICHGNHLVYFRGDVRFIINERW